MRVVAWLLLVQVCRCLAEDVDLTENKTYRFIVSKEGFSVKICGTGSGNPLLCYDGFRDRSTGDPLHTKCPDFTSCVIKAEYRTDKKLLVNYGGGVGHFKSECAVIKVQETIQTGLDAKKNLNQNGGCHWTTDAKGMLEFDVTTAVSFTMTIFNVTSIPDHPEATDGIMVLEKESESDDRAKPRKKEVDGSTADEKPKRKREKPKKVADSVDESGRYETDHPKTEDEREGKKML
uniref:Uncharacterized protein n=1 Tax=Panagrolaimus sp. JU765 TaxID=591449 RepID=A0AC34RE91_9BILA